MKINALLFPTLLCFLTSYISHASVPVAFTGKIAVEGINFQGAAKFTFSIIDEEGQVHWKHALEENATIENFVTNGRYIVLLGGQGMQPLPSELFLEHDHLLLRVSVDLLDGAGLRLLQPDQSITASPYSLVSDHARHADHASIAEGVSPSQVSRSMLAGDILADLNRTIDRARLSADVQAKLDEALVITREMLPEDVRADLNRTIALVDLGADVRNELNATIGLSRLGEEVKAMLNRTISKAMLAEDILSDLNRTIDRARLSADVQAKLDEVLVITREMLPEDVRADLNRTIAPGSVTESMLSQSVINIINKPLPDGAISNLSQIDPKFTRYFTPTIIVSPESTSLIQGSNGSLSVEADGQFLSYQWFKNGEAIPNITSSSLVLENAKFETDDANYSVVVTNDWGAVESALVKVQVLTSLPLISLVGDDPYQLEAALTFVDPGASAQDALGNDLSYKILVEGADFNTSNLGSYQVLYTVTDDGGNTSTKERTVTVDDTLSPELQLLGDANITQLLDTPWVDPGVEAQDERDGNITADIVVSGSVGVNTTGIYTLTYTVSDAAGNEANATRTVTVRVPDHLLELNSTVSLEMIWVEAGTFTMGQVGVAEPEHEVTLTNGFYLGKYEVTQPQYEAVMTGNNDGLSATPSNWPNNSDRPVEKVSYEDIQKFLTRLNAQEAGNIAEGWAYVLPTEAQWEYACRAGTTTAYSWGDTITASDANWNHGNDAKQTEDVGQYSANPWGFFDMHGNVWEWTSDWYAVYSSGAVSDPEGPATGSSRVFRGGSWNAAGAYLRSAGRNFSNPSARYANIGFRVGFQQVPADVASPELQLLGDANITQLLDTPWVDPGVEAQDERDGNITADIVVSGSVDVNTTGTYTLTYTVSDAAGNEANATRIVEVLASTHTADLNSTVNLEMIWVEPGTFTMGQVGVAEPEHEVTLTNGFYLGKYEVTQAQYEAVMTGNTDGLNTKPSNWPDNPNRPVEKVSWEDTQVFLARLNAQDAGNIPAGWAYVLPTEAQWEYACRAGTTTAYSWGDTIVYSNANQEGSGYAQTRDVGLYDANPWGFFDMHGNVWEWTSDWHAAYSSGAVTDPEGPATGSNRAKRGGSWSVSANGLRSAYRNYTVPSNRYHIIGFRVGFRQVQ